MSKGRATANRLGSPNRVAHARPAFGRAGVNCSTPERSLLDELSDLTYYGFRYYDKTSMTWNQSDPLYRFVPDLAQLGSPRRAQLYAFSLNNPNRYVDRMAETLTIRY